MNSKKIDAASLLETLKNFKKKAATALGTIKDIPGLETFRLEWIGKKGTLTEALKNLSLLSAEERPKVGALANEIRVEILSQIDALRKNLEEKAFNEKLQDESIDVTLPGRMPQKAQPHPIRIVQNEIVKIFESCGFLSEVGPELEHEFFNFDALNIPAAHPSRTLQDTFYIKDHPELVLRTHTSPVQIRTLLLSTPPIRILCPGRVFRADYDQTHAPMFHQVEGLCVDTDIHMGDLKGILSLFVREFFGESLAVRLRPSYFPFTEPSAEVDMECALCHGRGCRVCKMSGWIEILGCGMVDPEVFKAVGMDPEKYRGFAFGMGIERVAMLKYSMNDLRSFFEADGRFISQFSGIRSL